MAILDSSYRWQLLHATLAYEINEQLKYHKANSKASHQIDHLLHLLGVICFSLTLVILAIFLSIYIVAFLLQNAGVASASNVISVLDSARSAMIFFSAGLPALGATFAGIRAYGDFEGSKQRSDFMLGALKTLEHDYQIAMDHQTGLNETAEMLISTARVMSEDIFAWQELYGRKRLVLPA
jgi:hypothetical protein